MQKTLTSRDQSLGQYLHRQGSSVVGFEPVVLTKIYDAQINLCILKRSISPEISEYAAFLQHAHSDFELTRPINLPGLEDVLHETLPQHRLRIHLIRDVVKVADMYSCLFGLDKIGLRLKLLDRAMCPRFHSDKLLCRLITTYSGKGTEWLEITKNDRLTIEVSNESYSDQGKLRHLDEGDIALLKGERWEGNEGFGVIHRSPALTPDETRLLLTLDFV